MCLEELLKQKQYLKVNDIQTMFDCSYCKAAQLMREIKNVSDTCLIKGKCTLADFEYWYNQPRKKLKEEKELTSENT